MPKFSDLVPLDTPWQFKLANLEGKVLTIYSAEPIKTQYGPAFLCEVYITPPMPDYDMKVNVLVGNTVPFDQINKLLEALDEAGEDFPVDVKVIQVNPGKGSRKYYMLVDPEDDALEPD